jgi:acyl carrier protein
MVVMVEKDYGIVINSQEAGEKIFSSLTSLAEYITTVNTSRSSS